MEVNFLCISFPCCVEEKKRRKRVITKGSTHFKEQMTLLKLDFFLFFLFFASVLCYLTLILPLPLSLSPSSISQQSRRTRSHHMYRRIKSSPCTASDGGALYNRASVFTASLWVSRGLQYKQHHSIILPAS